MLTFTGLHHLVLEGPTIRVTSLDELSAATEQKMEAGTMSIKVCCISDTHSFHEQLDLEPGDILIHAGDFTCRGSREEVSHFTDWLRKQDYKYKIVIAGNHELTFDRTRYAQRLAKFLNKPAQLESFKASCDPNVFAQMIRDAGDNCFYLEHEPLEVLGYKFFGTPYIPVISDWAFMLKREERAQKWAEIPTDTQILITHTPPLGILDDSSERRSGCEELRREVLERIRPIYHICGHIHEGYGQATQDGIHFINAASVNEDYVIVNAPIYFELPACSQGVCQGDAMH